MDSSDPRSYTHTYVHTCMCVQYKNKHVYTVHMYVHIYKYMQIHRYIHLYKYMHIYLYVRTHAQTHT